TATAAMTRMVRFIRVAPSLDWKSVAGRHGWSASHKHRETFFIPGAEERRKTAAGHHDSVRALPYSVCSRRPSAIAAHSRSGVAGITTGGEGKAPPQRVGNGVHHGGAGADGARLPCPLHPERVGPARLVAGLEGESWHIRGARQGIVHQRGTHELAALRVVDR